MLLARQLFDEATTLLGAFANLLKRSVIRYTPYFFEFYNKLKQGSTICADKILPRSMPFKKLVYELNGLSFQDSNHLQEDNA